METEEKKANWFEKGATLSDKSAREEFSITQEEIHKAINEGKLQYHMSNAHGNPYLKLLRSEVEAYIDEKYGKNYLQKKKTETELAQINKELRSLKKQATTLEQKKAKLLEDLDEQKKQG
ncbi:MAG: hypothetical protein V1718_05695 [archaeon]